MIDILVLNIISAQIYSMASKMVDKKILLSKIDREVKKYCIAYIRDNDGTIICTKMFDNYIENFNVISKIFNHILCLESVLKKSKKSFINSETDKTIKYIRNIDDTPFNKNIIKEFYEGVYKVIDSILSGNLTINETTMLGKISEAIEVINEKVDGVAEGLKTAIKNIEVINQLVNGELISEKIKFINEKSGTSNNYTVETFIAIKEENKNDFNSIEEINRHVAWTGKEAEFDVSMLKIYKDKKLEYQYTNQALIGKASYLYNTVSISNGYDMIKTFEESSPSDMKFKVKFNTDTIKLDVRTKSGDLILSGCNFEITREKNGEDIDIILTDNTNSSYKILVDIKEILNPLGIMNIRVECKEKSNVYKYMKSCEIGVKIWEPEGIYLVNSEDGTVLVDFICDLTPEMKDYYINIYEFWKNVYMIEKRAKCKFVVIGEVSHHDIFQVELISSILKNGYYLIDKPLEFTIKSLNKDSKYEGLDSITIQFGKLDLFNLELFKNEVLFTTFDYEFIEDDKKDLKLKSSGNSFFSMNTIDLDNEKIMEVIERKKLQ